MLSDECKTGRLDESVRVLWGMNGGPACLHIGIRTLQALFNIF